jgi:hypothetical protein
MEVKRKLPEGWRWVRLGDVCEQDFEKSRVRAAGALPALRTTGNPAEVPHEAKERIFPA